METAMIAGDDDDTVDEPAEDEQWLSLPKTKELGYSR
jgi:hypothetical protein